MAHARLPLLILCAGLCGCGGKDAAPAKTPAPAAVANPVSEASLTSLTLTAEAVSRLGIETATSAVESVSRTRSAGGEVIAPPGGDVTVTAPAAGTLQVAGDAAPVPGSRVARGQTIFLLFAIQPPERDLDAESRRDAATAEAELTVATQRAQRLERLLADGAASARAVEEARAQQKVAEANAAARVRAKEIRQQPDWHGCRLAFARNRGSPAIGWRRTRADGCCVGAALPGGPDRLVVGTCAAVRRRPERCRLDQARDGDGLGGGPAINAVPATGPPSADAATATSNVFYALSRQERPYGPARRVSVQLPLIGSEQALVVPTASVVYDMNGGGVTCSHWPEHVCASPHRDSITDWRQDTHHAGH